MNDSTSDDHVDRPAAKPGPRESRPFDASTRLSELLARPLGKPVSPGDATAEPRARLVERVLQAAPRTPPEPAEAGAPPPPFVEPAPEPQPPPVDLTPEPPPPVEPAAEPKALQSAPPDDPSKEAAPLPPPADQTPPPLPPIDEAAPSLPAIEPTPQPPPPPEQAALPSLPPEVEKPPDPDAARYLSKIRRLMLVSNLFMFIAVAAVLGVIGYRVFRSEGSVAPVTPPAAAPAPAETPVDMTLSLPRGAKVVQAGVAEDRIVITIEIDGTLEIRTFDAKTLRPAGRMSFTTVP